MTKMHYASGFVIRKPRDPALKWLYRKRKQSSLSPDSQGRRVEHAEFGIRFFLITRTIRECNRCRRLREAASRYRSEAGARRHIARAPGGQWFASALAVSSIGTPDVARLAIQPGCLNGCFLAEMPLAVSSKSAQ
jgi:hypothetical protein